MVVGGFALGAQRSGLLALRRLALRLGRVKRRALIWKLGNAASLRLSSTCGGKGIASSNGDGGHRITTGTST